MARRQRFRWVNSAIVALSRVASGEVDEAGVRGRGCEAIVSHSMGASKRGWVTKWL